MVQQVARRKLNIERNKSSGMHVWCICSPWMQDEDTLCCIGLLIYAVCIITNGIRFASGSNDLSEEDMAFWLTQIGYRYFLTKEVLNLTTSSAELKSIADQNYDLFMRYQTWLHGDLLSLP